LLKHLLLRATNGNEIVNAPAGVQFHAHIRERLLHRPNILEKIYGKVRTPRNNR